MAGARLEVMKRDVARCLALLRDSDLSLSLIAERLNVSRSWVAHLSRQSGTRQYGGLRTHWTVDGERRESPFAATP